MVLTSGSRSPSLGDTGGGEDAAVLPETLDIAKGVGDDVGGELDDMVYDDDTDRAQEVNWNQFYIRVGTGLRGIREHVF